MSMQRAREALARFGADGRILEFDVSSATVPLAAKALGCGEAQIAKSLSFRLGERVLVIVTSGDERISNPKFKARFGGKAVMLPRDEVEECLGHAAGGVCPFGLKEGVELYLDCSLRAFDIVYPAAGTANSAIPLTVSELEEFTGHPEWVDVCKGREGGAP